MTSTKTFNSQIALNLHVCGMHGPGWTAPCGKHYKWKSSYLSHMQDCKECIKIHADQRIKKFLLLKQVDLTGVKVEHWNFFLWPLWWQTIFIYCCFRSKHYWFLYQQGLFTETNVVVCGLCDATMYEQWSSLFFKLIVSTRT